MRSKSTIDRLFLLVVVILLAASVAVAESFGDLWSSDSLTKVMRSSMPGDAAGDAVAVSGGRGEIVSGQAVFRPRTDVGGAVVSVSDLIARNSNGRIPASAVKLQWVRYIDITERSEERR